MYVDILILASLARHPQHGYEIKKSVEEVLGRPFAINNNLLYPALRRFEELGAVEREVEHQIGKPDRHVYRLTDQGGEVLDTLLREFPPQLAEDDAEFLVRVGFFERLSPAERSAILATRELMLRGYLNRLRLGGSPEVVPLDRPYATRIRTFLESRICHELAWIDDLKRDLEGV
jgi:DNA-binding PadR family transcriptional regulator